ncbi:MAG: NDP-hexose 2,3-dehydratase family protein [Candidatus Binatia bacterium]|nr:NDP-hexose 2,3-dehydratase family protein [Candidatus Binatia bacterium]
MTDDSAELSFLRSSLVPESPVFDNSNFLSWFGELRDSNGLRVRPIRFDEMDRWGFEPSTRNLVHNSGRFFRIEGLRVETNFGDDHHWDQPIINQPEIGILGILAKRFGGILHFLMQAKAEPGNCNALQLSPTVQATRSNYSQVHGGRVPDYLEHFTAAPLERRLVDQLQTEQGSRFLKKRNRNMIVETLDEVPVRDGFRWLTLGEIKRLHSFDNFVNMDARSVISCIPFLNRKRGPADLSEARGLAGFAKDLLESVHAEDRAVYTMDALLAWITEMKTRFELRTETIPLGELRSWNITERAIAHESGRFFSVIAVDVEAGMREVARWTQPMLRDTTAGHHGFITQKHKGVLHFLVQAKVEPGNIDVVDLAPTVSLSNTESRRANAQAFPFLDRFLDSRPDEIRHSTIQSEEGGRFFQFLNHNVILEVGASEVLDVPDYYTWMTLGQLLEFLRHGYLCVDSRTLLSCLSWA